MLPREAEILPDFLAKGLCCICAWVSFQLCGNWGSHCFSDPSYCNHSVPGCHKISPQGILFFPTSSTPRLLTLRKEVSVLDLPHCKRLGPSPKTRPGAFPHFSNEHICAVACRTHGGTHGWLVQQQANSMRRTSTSRTK